MSVGFKAVQWSRAKLVYDAILLAGLLVFLAIFLLSSGAFTPTKPYLERLDIWIRAFGCAAFLMMTLILSIGPLARLDARFLPVLYNRRHFGVLTFLVACTHVGLMLEWFSAQGALPTLINDFITWSDYGRFTGFPFKTLGLLALAILFVMAATSHDFWLQFLGPPAWKALHMGVYVAYGLVVMHVALGIMQFDRSAAIPLMLVSCFSAVAALHIAAGWREAAQDAGQSLSREGWLVVGPADQIPDKQARIVAAPGGERIAIFRDGVRIGAVTNRCAHQNGPLGEGRIVDGCITCPWHGYQYRLETGCAPAPFTEKLATYRVRVRGGVVEVHPEPLAAGTPASIVIGQGG